jgi:uncharacterized membrane protein YeaQ/YmgE (transglycosylase-associated protein family)
MQTLKSIAKNLVTLIIGIVIGFMGEKITTPVHAQAFMPNIVAKRIVLGNVDVGPTLNNLFTQMVAKGMMTKSEMDAIVVKAETNR